MEMELYVMTIRKFRAKKIEIILCKGGRGGEATKIYASRIIQVSKN